MFDKFGEFDSAEELNNAAAAKLAAGDTEAVTALALENGIDREDAEDYIGGTVPELATPKMAAIGKLEKEAADTGIKGILSDWKNTLLMECRENEGFARAVRKKGKTLAEFMSILIAFSFENKVQVSDKIVNITKVTVNGKKEAMRKPLYLGVPTQAEVKRMARKYYMGKEG